MKISIENLGVIRYAEIELGKFTIICGMNNHGKTYVTYALYGFLHFWNNSFVIPVDKAILEKLQDTGICSIPVQNYINDFSLIIDMACDKYSKQLASVFSAQKNKFENAAFSIHVSPDEIMVIERIYEEGIKSPNTKTGLTILKKPKDDALTVTLFSETSKMGTIPDFIII